MNETPIERADRIIREYNLPRNYNPMNTETKHTPGKWSIDGTSIVADHPVLGPVQIAILARTTWTYPDQNKNSFLRSTEQGDANLIASAPDMAKELAQLRADKVELVAALEQVTKSMEAALRGKRDIITTPEETVTQARALIAKHAKV